MTEKVDKIFAQIGSFWLKEISEGILRQIEDKNAEEKKENYLPPIHQFVSLLSLPKQLFLKYEKKLRAGLKITSPTKKIKEFKCPKTVKSIQILNKSSEYLDKLGNGDEEVKIDEVGEIIQPKKRGNTTRKAEKWEYFDFTTIATKDEGHIIYHRNDSTQPQKCINEDSTVVLKSNIESRLRLLSWKQLPDIFDLQLHIHDSIVNVNKEGRWLLDEFLTNSFPNSVQKLTLFASLSKTKTEPVDDKLVDSLKRIIWTCVKDFIYLPDWNFTKIQLNSILNDCNIDN